MSNNGMSNNGYFDLSGVFKVQQNYILDLSNSYPNVNNAATIATYVNNLQNQMNNVSQSYDQANTSGSAVLTQQNQMIGIITAEQQRLLAKKQLIDQANSQEERIALLNNSYRLRYSQYTKMLIVVIISLFIYVGIQILVGFFAQVPTIAVIILHILNFAVCGIILIYMYADLKSRDQINYNQINLPPPPIDACGNLITTPAAASDFNNLWSGMGFCYGQQCCGPNTNWDTNTMTCLSNSSLASTPTTATGIPSATGMPSGATTGMPSGGTTGMPSAAATGMPSEAATGMPSATPSETMLSATPSNQSNAMLSVSTPKEHFTTYNSYSVNNRYLPQNQNDMLPIGGNQGFPLTPFL